MPTRQRCRFCSGGLTLASHARHRITAQHVELQSKIRARYYNHLLPCPVRVLHTIDYHLALLEPLGVTNASREIRLDLPAEAIARADELRRSFNIPEDFVLLHPGSARAEKFWQPDRWGEVIDHAQRAHDLSCVVTGAASAMEQTHIAEIRSSARERFTDLSGKT